MSAGWDDKLPRATSYSAGRRSMIEEEFPTWTPFELYWAIESDPLRWPLLTLANATPRKAFAVKVEWMTNGPKTKCNMGHWHQEAPLAEFNYQQIFRSRSFHDKSEAKAKLEVVCDNIETALRSGKRTSYGTMGSIPSLLGRWPRKTDDVSLSFLREPVLLTDENLYADNPKYRCSYEWIVECTVVAVAK